MTLLSPRSLAVILVTTSALLLSACGSRDCTLAGCTNEPVSVVRKSSPCRARRGLTNVTADDGTLLPDDFEVEVSVGGSLVTQESGGFEYDEFKPNGPDCAPTCRNSDGAFIFVERKSSP